MKYGDIVKLNGKLGKLVTNKKDGVEHFYFHPIGYGNYYIDDLIEVTEETIVNANTEEKIKYIEDEFNWGNIIQTIHIPVSNIQIIEYMDRHSKNKVSYHVYIDFRDTNTSYETMDSALVGAIGYKYEGGNGKAAGYFMKMINE